MLKHLPVDDDHTILRRFGDEPELFGTVRFQGAPLLGHNGIDLAAPEGTAVHAVENGVVLRARVDAAGFGAYVLLSHVWGQTLYARLQNVQVREGEQVTAGTHLGDIAPANNASKPHLHFGMRILPYSVSDGWAGYVDPQPYLDRLATPLGPIIGPHIIATIQPHLPTLARWQPRIILLLDPNPDEVRALRQVCPNSILIARLYHPEHEIEQRIRHSPQSAAQWAHTRILAHWSPDIDYWQISNEILQDQNGLPLLNQFELYRMQLADSHGYKCAIHAFSVGNPDLPQADRMARWKQVYPSLAYAEQHGHIVALHQYGMPTLWGPNNAYDWYIHRLEHQVLRRLPFKRLKFAVTEFGIDGLIQGGRPAGWQTFATPEQYTAQLIKAGRYLERFSGRILGYCIFTLGHYMPWNSYDIAGPVADQLADQLERGTWAEVDTQVLDIFPGDTDSTTEPGPEAFPAQPDEKSPADESDEGEGEEDEEPDSNPPTAAVTRRISPWVAHYNMRHSGLINRIGRLDTQTAATNPDKPDDPEALVFLIKDIFTTRNGVWEPDGEPGSVPAWARADYLRPIGAPDYFDDAGGDHHLFAAVIGPDGTLMRNQRIAFWSDGLEQATLTTYRGFIYRDTKAHSGWANVVIGPGSSFVPERGESGPWCWAPVGAAEVMCGGGLPALHHISTFAVWQAVRRGDLYPDPDTGGDNKSDDYTIYIPGVKNTPPPRWTTTGGDTLLDAAMLTRLRRSAWVRLGLEGEADSPLAEFARLHSLGRPLTQIFTLAAMRGQGFERGVVYQCSHSPHSIDYISW
jgi:hypothetical protein